MGEHAAHLFGDALGADDLNFARVAAHRVQRRLIEREVERGGEAHGAKHPQFIFRDARVGIADRPHHPRGDIGLAADEVDHAVGERVVEQPVDREVAAERVFLGRAEGVVVVNEMEAVGRHRRHDRGGRFVGERRGQRAVFRRFNEQVNELLGGWGTESGAREWYPSMDLLEEKDRLVVRLDLPGIDPKTVEINLQGDMLTISGERKDESESREGKILKREHRYGAFQRTLQLPFRVLGDKVKAAYERGVMTITLPKVEEQVGRHIPVEVK